MWYALPDLHPLADPVRFQLNVNGGTTRGGVVALAPDQGPNWWSVLDLAAARQVGIPLRGPVAAEVIPPVPPPRLRAAIAESIGWHADADAGSPNRVLNLARLLLLVEDGRWCSKPEGAAQVRDRYPELAPAVDAALAARAEGRWMDPALAGALQERVTRALG